VAALVATGYEVFAINPMSVARYRERHSTSGANSDSADAHVLAEIVRLDRGHHRPLAGDSDQGEAIKLTARTHQSLVWDRTRHVLRLRSTLREFFAAALTAFPDLDAPDALELLRRAPDPEQAAQLTRSRITAALRRAHRRDVEDKTAQLRAILRAEQTATGDPVRLCRHRDQRGRHHRGPERPDRPARPVVSAHFGRHPDAEIYASQPGLGTILAARVLDEFGDGPHRYIDAKARKSYAGTAPITRASGTKRIALARYARNRRLGGLLR
jgi:hypothetical protein